MLGDGGALRLEDPLARGLGILARAAGLELPDLALGFRVAVLERIRQGLPVVAGEHVLEVAAAGLGFGDAVLLAARDAAARVRHRRHRVALRIHFDGGGSTVRVPQGVPPAAIGVDAFDPSVGVVCHDLVQLAIGTAALALDGAVLIAPQGWWRRHPPRARSDGRRRSD